MAEASRAQREAEDGVSEAAAATAAAEEEAVALHKEVATLQETVNKLTEQCTVERDHAAMWEQRYMEATRDAGEAAGAASKKLSSAMSHCRDLEAKLAASEAAMHLKETTMIDLREERDLARDKAARLEAEARHQQAAEAEDPFTHCSTASSDNDHTGGRRKSLPGNDATRLEARPGELDGLRAQLRELDTARSTLAQAWGTNAKLDSKAPPLTLRQSQELVSLQSKNTELQRQVTRMPKLEQACKRLKKSYNGALEMAGEKGEEVEVLQGEMQQVKEVGCLPPLLCQSHGYLTA